MYDWKLLCLPAVTLSSRWCILWLSKCMYYSSMSTIFLTLLYSLCCFSLHRDSLFSHSFVQAFIIMCEVVILQPLLLKWHASAAFLVHYNDIMMSTMTSQITSLTIVYSAAYLGVDQRRHQSSVSLAFVRGIHRWPVNSPHKGPVTRKMFPFDDVIMCMLL